MAINFEKLKQEKETEVLSESELQTIKMIEEEIDDQLQQDYDEGEIMVGINAIEYISYENNPGGEIRTGLTTTCRGLVMYKQILKNYSDAGWRYREGKIDGIPYVICFKGTNNNMLTINNL